MGMYTGLWGKIKLADNPMGQVMQVWFEELYCNEDMLGIVEAHGYNWVSWFIASFKAIRPDGLDDTTAEQIAEGITTTQRLWLLTLQGDTSMPWDAEETTYNSETKTLKFTSSIKNYSSEIGVFVQWVLPKIAVAWDLMSMHEDLELNEATKHQHNVELL